MAVRYRLAAPRAAEWLSRLNPACLLFGVIHEVNISTGKLLCEGIQETRSESLATHDASSLCLGDCAPAQ